jgi:hypothetical protein
MIPHVSVILHKLWLGGSSLLAKFSALVASISAQTPFTPFHEFAIPLPASELYRLSSFVEEQHNFPVSTTSPSLHQSLVRPKSYAT